LRAVSLGDFGKGVLVGLNPEAGEAGGYVFGKLLGE